MSDLNTSNTPSKQKLISDIKQLVADVEELLHVTTEQANEKVAGLQARIRDNLSATRRQLTEVEAVASDKATVAIQEAIRKASEAAEAAAVAAQNAAQTAEEAAKKAAESGKEAAQRAAEATREATHIAAAAAKEAAVKAFDILKNWVR